MFLLKFCGLSVKRSVMGWDRKNFNSSYILEFHVRFKKSYPIFTHPQTSASSSLLSSFRFCLFSEEPSTPSPKIIH